MRRNRTESIFGGLEGSSLLCFLMLHMQMMSYFRFSHFLLASNKAWELWESKARAQGSFHEIYTKGCVAGITLSSLLHQNPDLSYAHHPHGLFNLPSNLLQCWQMWNSHQCHGAEQSIHSYSADPAELHHHCQRPKESGGRVRSAQGGWIPSPTWITPQGHVRSLSGKGGRILFPFLCLLHLVLPCRAADDGHSQGYGAALQVLLVGHRGGGQSHRVSRWAHPITHRYKQPAQVIHRWQNS